jgi:hypothetical protein
MEGLGIELRRQLMLAGEDQNRIAGHEADEREGHKADAEKGRYEQTDAPDDEAKHSAPNLSAIGKDRNAEGAGERLAGP